MRFYHFLACMPSNVDQDWTERGGIIGRGVLVDFAGWAKRNGVTIVPNSCQRVSLATIKAILEEEKVTIQPGDILIIRTGLIQAYNQCASDEDRDSLMRSSQTIGVEATEDMLRWLWNQHFAAVAGDAVAFETQPYSGDVGESLSSNHSGPGVD